MASDGQKTIDVHHHHTVVASTPEDMNKKLDAATRLGFSIVQVAAAADRCWVIMRKVKKEIVQPVEEPMSPEATTGLVG